MNHELSALVVSRYHFRYLVVGRDRGVILFEFQKIVLVRLERVLLVIGGILSVEREECQKRQEDITG